jgi:hypothetical protein
MKLPNALLSIVAKEKMVDYVLNPAHPDNGGKAEFFAALGFNREDWQKLADAFSKLAQSAEVSKSMASLHGQKYILDGRMESPSGKTPRVRTIWIVDHGQDAPRLVTAYPTNE